MRPDSAARRPRAAAVVVLPTPPEPQQTTIWVAGSSMSASTSSAGRLARDGAGAHASTVPAPTCGSTCESCGSTWWTKSGTRRSASSRTEPESTPSGRAGSEAIGKPGGLQERELLALEVDALGVVAGLLEQAVDELGRRLDAGLAELGADRGLVQPTLAGLLERGVVEEWLAHHVDDDRARVQTLGAQVLDGLERLLDRHLLEQGHDVHDGLLGLEQAGDRAGLRGDRPDAGEVGDLGVDREEAADASRRRRVQDDAVVDRGGVALVLAVAAAPVGLVDLADEQDVPDAGRDGRREVDGAELLEELARASELVEQLEVLQQGGLGLDRQADDLAAPRQPHDAGLVGAERGHVEGLADALAALDLGQQHVGRCRREGECDRRGDRGLARAALAGDDVQPRSRPGGAWAGRHRVHL